MLPVDTMVLAVGGPLGVALDVVFLAGPVVIIAVLAIHGRDRPGRPAGEPTIEPKYEPPTP